MLRISDKLVHYGYIAKNCFQDYRSVIKNLQKIDQNLKKLDREIGPLYGHHGVRYKLTTSGSKKDCLLIIFASPFRTVPSASFSFFNSAIHNFRSFFINVTLPKILFFVFVSNHSVFSCIHSCFCPPNFFL